MVQFTVRELTGLQKDNKAALKEALRQVKLRREDVVFTAKQIAQRKREDKKKKSKK